MAMILDHLGNRSHPDINQLQEIQEIQEILMQATAGTSNPDILL
jgi:hypothetical protein